jgi:hypothetical protein
VLSSIGPAVKKRGALEDGVRGSRAAIAGRSVLFAGGTPSAAFPPGSLASPATSTEVYATPSARPHAGVKSEPTAPQRFPHGPGAPYAPGAAGSATAAGGALFSILFAVLLGLLLLSVPELGGPLRLVPVVWRPVRHLSRLERPG